MRRTKFVVPVDTCQFSPLQLQPATALRFGMTALAGCIGNQLVDWRALKKEYRTTVVIASVRLDYLGHFTFFSAPHIQVDAGLIARGGGRFIELDCRLAGDGDDEFARLRVVYRPVRLSGTDALDATPTDIDRDLLALFRPDEQESARLDRPLPNRLSNLETKCELIDEGQTGFKLSRADCEIADQWQNVRLPEWIASGRERLIFDGADGRLKAGLREPMTSLLAEFRRPMFLGDEARLRTRAFVADGSVAFVHEVFSLHPGVTEAQQTLCAVAIEEFPAHELGSTVRLD